jgi:hypothetical protein
MTAGGPSITDDEALPPGADAFSRALADLADDFTAWVEEDDEPPG